MARKTKVQVIEELFQLGIQFDENAKYNDLVKLLKEYKPETKTKPKPKEQPETWPFSKENIANEKMEMEHVSRLLNMKYDNPGAKYITKVVVFDCQSRKVVCEDYKIEY